MFICFRAHQQAQIFFKGKSRYIGVFDTAELAAKAYNIVKEKIRQPGHNRNNDAHVSDTTFEDARTVAIDSCAIAKGKRKKVMGEVDDVAFEIAQKVAEGFTAIGTKDNPADLFTKSTLDVSTFTRHAASVKGN